MINIRALVYFLETVETFSFTKTASRFGVSVPTVSSNLSRLEELIGYPVFVRSRLRIISTQGSELLRGEARMILRGLLEIESGEKVDDTAPDFLDRCHELKISVGQLSRFAAVKEVGSINRAAELLHVTQPQVSRQLAKLERLLGHGLFERAPHGSTPTDRADTLYRTSRPICEAHDRLTHGGNKLFSKSIQTTRLGSVPPFHPDSRLSRYICDLCAKWETRWPASHIAINNGETDTLLSALIAGDLHAAIVETDTIPNACDSRAVFGGRLELVIGVQAQGIDFQEALTMAPLVLQSRKSHLRQTIDRWLAHKGIVPNNPIEVGSTAVIRRLITEHGYCSLVPHGAFPAQSDRHISLPIPNPPSLMHRMIWKSQDGLSRPLQRLLDTIENMSPAGNVNQRLLSNA